MLLLLQLPNLCRVKMSIDGSGDLAMGWRYPPGDPWEGSYRFSWTQANDNFDPNKPLVTAYRVTRDGALVES